MKIFIQFLFFFFLVTQISFAQLNRGINESRKFLIKSHDHNLKSFPEKSFYKQKENWQYIIDTTWGPGLPLAQKQQIFNTFANSVRNSFDGFNSLGMSIADWDTLRNYYYSKIDSNTSRGRFCAIMQYFSSQLRDGHTWCDDIGVYTTPLNPGVPFFVFGGVYNATHFGAVTTVLPDSSVLVLRVVANYPLNLEPGDIILGYEGVPWKYLIEELIEAELPNRDYWGAYSGSYTDHLFIGAGMNWHLFDTLDVLKYSTSDTVHLSVTPLQNLSAPSLLNNEQIEIPEIPFPNYFNGEVVTYGILNNTNIGYIYVFSEWPSGPANEQFIQAVSALQNTDALIIDMRWNEGGSAQWHPAFSILANETFYTIQSVNRCQPSTFDLCLVNDRETFKITGSAPTKYDSPIAVLLGPSCLSDGEMNANRLIHLYNVKTFGKPTWGSLGMPSDISNSNWYMSFSLQDKFHINNPGVFLNRSEFPIDYPIWHNPVDVAQGKDAVVEKALWWINNLVYPHSAFSDKTFYIPEDTVHLTTTIENPNSHPISARAYLKTVEGVLIDSTDLAHQLLNPSGEIWMANFSLPMVEEFYKISITSFDQTTSEYFTVPNATRLTTAGPVQLDSISFTRTGTLFSLRPYVRNEGTSLSITDAKIRLYCDDPWISAISAGYVGFPILIPGSSVGSNAALYIRIIDSLFTDTLNLRAEIICDGWPYWKDSLQLIILPVGVEDEINKIPTEYSLAQNYPNPFNPSTTISWQSPVGGWQTIKLFDVLGREIETIVDGYYEDGIHSTLYIVNSSLPSGVYFYQLKAGDFVQTKKMLLLK